jgi:predicted phosphoribosyltransferase
VRFRNRRAAGERLTTRLQDYAGVAGVIVLALPRGGVPVAFEIASALAAPLDVFLVRKLGVPGHPELAMGAIAEGGVEVLSKDLIQDLGIPSNEVGRSPSGNDSSSSAAIAFARGGRHPFAWTTARSSWLTTVSPPIDEEAAVVALRRRARPASSCPPRLRARRASDSAVS